MHRVIDDCRWPNKGACPSAAPPFDRSTQASLEAAEEVNGKTAPQLEQLKWQARQHQKRVDDIACAQQEAAKVWEWV